MGGTEKYGKFIVYSLLLVSFTIGAIPLFTVIEQINFHIIIPIEHLSNQTIGNVTQFIGQITIRTISEISVDKFTKYFYFIFTFIFFLGFAFALIGILHIRIKKRKNEELNRIETIIKNINFDEVDNSLLSIQKQYFLILHEKILSLTEWPIRKIFIIDLLISIALLFISVIF